MTNVRRSISRLIILVFFILTVLSLAQAKTETFKLAVHGMTHDHIIFLLREWPGKAYKVVGFAEPDRSVFERYQQEFNLPDSMYYSSLEELLNERKPDGVANFGDIKSHLTTVQLSAPRGVHVMVEKPLAISHKEAIEIKRLADLNNIHVLTNYETSWYKSSHWAYRWLVDSEQKETLRKAVFHHGHWGPKEIGVSQQFLNWLLDPELAGGGAIMDFGCYGANIISWYNRGEIPDKVTAITQQLKSDVAYTNVDDEATIILTYPSYQVIIQASWNWPYNRKDMELYTEAKTVLAPSKDVVRVKELRRRPFVEHKLNDEPWDIPYNLPFEYFVLVATGEISMVEFSPYTIENNIIVARILDAARKSARKGKAVSFK